MKDFVNFVLVCKETPKQLSYSDYLINFELFYRSIDNLKILSGDNLDFIKTRIKDSALTSFRNYNANVPQHLF